MKRVAIVLAVAVSVILVSARMGVAGHIHNNDMTGSKMMVQKPCMPPAVFIGVVYGDRENNDGMDAASAICYSKQRGEFEIPNPDFGARAKVRARCNHATEYVWGIAYKDREGSDDADGVTVICRNKKSGAQRTVSVADLSGGRSYITITGKNAIGIACNDRKDSDSIDGCTLLTK